MPFWRLYYHLVWSTKNREPLIQPQVEHRLFGYLREKANQMGCEVYAINGWHDHVHVLVSIPPKHSVSDVVKNLKGASAFHINHDVPGPQDGWFGWQRGYGVFSLGERQIAVAEEYVARQKEHHSENTWNPWLERWSEEDEGPGGEQGTHTAHSQTVRERGEVYAAEGPLF
jgi:putative transposase